jgi:hypothetical protein
MEQKTQALDRMLGALSPALAAELDRLIEETRQQLEAEFQERLESALRETQAAEGRLQQAVEEAKDAVRKQVADELETQFRQELEAATVHLKNAATADRAKLQQDIEQWRTFAEAEPQLAQAPSQSEMLSRFLNLTGPFADTIGLYLMKADALTLWKHRGTTAFPKSTSPSSKMPDSYLKLIDVRGKTVAAVLATAPLNSQALDFLSASLERAIELFGLRLRIPVSNQSVTATAGSFGRLI